MKLGYDLSLPFFEIYEIDQEISSFDFLEKDGIKLYPLTDPEISQAKKIIHPLSSKLNIDLEIVYYGGSFNPWHQGHKACLDLLPSEKQIVVILDKNPQKDSLISNPGQKWKELCQHLSKEIYPGFLLKQKRNPTIDWINSLHQKYPDSKSSLLIGYDQLKNFHTWSEVEELSKKIHTLYVVSRLETENELELIINELKTKYNLTIVSLGHHPYEDLSSTIIRKTNQ